MKDLPILPMKNTALLPNLVMPLSVGRPRSLAAVEASLATEDKEILLIAQKEASIENPGRADLYDHGTRAIIRRMSRNNDLMEVLVMGVERVKLIEITQEEPHLIGRVEATPVPGETGAEVEALQRSVVEIAQRAIEITQVQVPFDLQQLSSDPDNAMRLVYLLASLFSLDLEKEQKLLDCNGMSEALGLLHGYLTHELQVLEIRNTINAKARDEMGKEQREHMLRQQMRAIQQELGEASQEQTEIDQLRERLAKAVLPDDVRKEAERELKRLERLPTQAPDHHVIRTYLEYVLDLPWRTATEDKLDIGDARRILDEDHFDLKEIKERILEHLGVLKMNPKAKAPILCLVGPPGVG